MNWPIKKIYFYTVCVGAMFMIVVGLFMLIAALIGKFIDGTGPGRGGVTIGASMLIIGLPVLFFHWKMAEKENSKN